MSDSKYRPEVDGLRCIAVMSVILYHAGLPWLRGGFIGVDIFFVISGYLITKIVYTELLSGQFSFAKFYERRVRRIFPALALMLVVTTAAGWMVLTPAQYKEFGQSLAACLLFLSNVYFYLKTGYFARQSEELPLLHTWSLSVEEQFYVVFPILLLVLCKWAPRWTRAVITVVLVGSLGLCIYRQFHLQQNLNFFDTSSRAWELLVGAWLGLAEVDRRTRFQDLPLSFRQALATLGICLVLGSALLIDPTGNHPGWQMLLPVIGTAMVLGFGTQGTWVAQALSWRPVVGIGLISYSAYLWHQPILALALHASGGHLAPHFTAGLILLTLAVAYLSWRVIETPFRTRSQVSSRTIWWFMGAGTAVLVGIGGVLHLGSGIPSRFGELQAIQSSSASPSPLRKQCHTEGLNYLKPAQACRYLDNRSVHWATLGDSHTVELAYALAEQLKAAGQGGVLHLSNSGCQPALDFESAVPGCSAWLKEALATLESDTQVTQVVLLWRHSFYLFGDQRLQYPLLPQEHPNFLPKLTADAARAQYLISFQHVVARLLAAGKTVWLLDPVPELQRSVEYNIYAPAMRSDPALQALGLPLSYYQLRHAFMLDGLAKFPAHSRLHRVSTANLYCPHETCLAMDRNQALYFDDNHLSVAGARRLADHLLSAASATGGTP